MLRTAPHGSQGLQIPLLRGESMMSGCTPKSPMGRRSRDPVQSSPATTGARSPGVRMRLFGGRAHDLPLPAGRRSWISADRAANFSAVIPGGSADERGQVGKWAPGSVFLDFLDVKWGQSQPHVLRHKCLRLCRMTKKDEVDQNFILCRQRKGRPSLTTKVELQPGNRTPE